MYQLKRFRPEHTQLERGDLDCPDERKASAKCESRRTANDRLRVARAIIVAAGVGLALWVGIALIMRAIAGW